MTYWRIGHRGAAGHVAENTLASFRTAMEMGVHGFEFDIQMSKDGQPVVIHDDTLEGTTNGTGFVHDYTLAELQQFDAGGGEKIPSLVDVMELVDKRTRLFIELKAPNCTEVVADILAHYVSHYGWSYDQFFACSFDHLQIMATRAINPDIRTVALFTGIPVSLALIAQEAGAFAMAPDIEHSSFALVDDAHKRNLKVFGWTANTPARIARAKELGMDGIISDFPDRL